MNSRNIFAMIVGSSVGSVIASRTLRDRRQNSSRQILSPVLSARIASGAIAGATAGALAHSLLRFSRRFRNPPPKEKLGASNSQILKPTPPVFFVDRGSGREYETRLASLKTFLTPNDRFFVRSHAPTPLIDAERWRLHMDGDGLRNPIVLNYGELSAMPQVTATRTIECAGNGRSLFKQAFGVEARGSQWGMGAIGCAEWTGVRMRELLERTGVARDAKDVMFVGLDHPEISRSIPIEKARQDDTLLVLKMNGEPLPPDHGFPARVLVSGWAGIASVKWLGRVIVSKRTLHSIHNTKEYVLAGPAYPPEPPALGPVITSMPVVSMLDRDWPAQFESGAHLIRGRAFAGEGRVWQVEYSIDEEHWKNAELIPPIIDGAWVLWQFEREFSVGEHQIRVRATDDRGRTQPESVPWNERGYLFNAIVAHPVSVTQRHEFDID